jgi:hypothetical protein
MVKIAKNLSTATLEVPNNTYDVEIESVDFKEAKENKHAGFTVWFKIFACKDNKLNGKLFPKFYSLAPGSDGFMRKFLIACGYTAQQLDNPAFEFDTDDLKGRTLQVDYSKVEGEKYCTVDNEARLTTSTQKKL